MAHNLTFQHYDANKAWASKLGVCLQEIYVHAMHLLSQELHTSFNSRVTSFERKLQFQMHRCGCAVLTFVCPSGSPHTHWSAALRLIGHCDQKYQAFILHSRSLVIWFNFGVSALFPGTFCIQWPSYMVIGPFLTCGCQLMSKVLEVFVFVFFLGRLSSEVVLAVMREGASTTPFLVRPQPEYLKTYIRYIAQNQAEHIIF